MVIWPCLYRNDCTSLKLLLISYPNANKCEFAEQREESIIFAKRLWVLARSMPYNIKSIGIKQNPWKIDKTKYHFFPHLRKWASVFVPQVGGLELQIKPFPSWAHTFYFTFSPEFFLLWNIPHFVSILYCSALSLIKYFFFSWFETKSKDLQLLLLCDFFSHIYLSQQLDPLLFLKWSIKSWILNEIKPKISTSDLFVITYFFLSS